MSNIISFTDYKRRKQAEKWSQGLGDLKDAVAKTQADIDRHKEELAFKAKQEAARKRQEENIRLLKKEGLIK